MSELTDTNRRTVLKTMGAGVAGGMALVGSATAEEEKIDWSLLGCQAVIPLVPVEADRVGILRDMVPDEFDLQEAGDFSGVFGDSERPIMGLEAFVCEGNRGDVPYMSHYTPVIPPSHLATDATWHFFKWEVLIDDPKLRKKLNAQGDRDPARPGDVKFKDDNVKGTFGEDTEGFVDITESGPAPSKFTFREFTPTGNEGQYIQWDVEVSGASLNIGQADLELTPKSRPSKVIGRTTVRNAPVLTGGLSFDPAKITLP